jgi:predicted O-methyltransferase YrrM
MSQDQWTAVDTYISDTLIPADAALDAALKASNAAGLPEIQVSAAQGKMLHLLARMKGARRILEVGTLGGYSTIWLARALPAGGRLITLELDSRHALVAQSNFERAGLGSVIELRLGKAADSMQQLVSEGGGPFDLIFIDADKEGYPEYFRWALKLSQPGTVIIADNMVRKGALADAASTDPMVQGVRRLNELVAAEPRVSATIVQTVGSKGYDGFALVLVIS